MGSPNASAPALPPALVAARALVAGLVAQGVRDVVLAPGSRSAPLAYALAAAADDGSVRLHVRVDERSAGFLALGLAKGSDPVAPVAVVTTSGTAVANLHPAVLEAHHTGVPLILLTADRPHELRGTGASQTTDQVGLFGRAVRYDVDVPAADGRDGEVRDPLAVTHRAMAAALGRRNGFPGPVHLNLAYRDPLQPPVGAALAASPALPDGYRQAVVPPSARPAGSDPALAGDPARTLVVAGDGAGQDARRLAEAQGWPLLAEPSSGACGGPNAIQAYRSLLGVEELGADVENVVVLGHPTLSRPVQRLLARPDVSVTVVAPGGAPWPDAARNAATVVDGLADPWFTTPTEPRDPSFLERWRTASAAAAAVVDHAAGDAAGPGPLAVARAVAAATTPDDVLVVGSSNPVRDLDLVLGLDAGPGAPPPAVVANRGLAGIDGIVSTATGVALRRSGGPGRTRALLGDLTFLHDVGGLLRGPLEPEADLQFVVVNDDGGSIFATLEHGALAAVSEAGNATFERVFGTPHGADLAALCRGYGVVHRQVENVADLREALANPVPGVEVVEVRVPRAGRLEESRALHEEIVRAVRGAATAASEGGLAPHNEQ